MSSQVVRIILKARNTKYNLRRHRYLFSFIKNTQEKSLTYISTNFAFYKFKNSSKSHMLPFQHDCNKISLPRFLSIFSNDLILKMFAYIWFIECTSVTAPIHRSFLYLYVPQEGALFTIIFLRKDVKSRYIVCVLFSKYNIYDFRWHGNGTGHMKIELKGNKRSCIHITNQISF